MRVCAELDLQLESFRPDDIKKIENSNDDTFFDVLNSINGHKSDVFNKADNLFPILRDSPKESDFKLTRKQIFRYLLKKIGLHIYLLNSKLYQISQNKVHLKINNQSVYRDLNLRELELSASLESLFEIIASLTEIVAFCFSNYEKHPVTIDNSSTFTNLKNIEATLNKVSFDEKIVQIIPDIENNFSLLRQAFLEIKDQISVFDWRTKIEEEIDLVLRFYVHDKNKKHELDEELMQELVHSAISEIESGYNLKPCKTYDNNIKHIIKDKRYKHSSTDKSYYQYGEHIPRDRDKRTLVSPPLNKIETRNNLNSELPVGKKS